MRSDNDPFSSQHFCAPIPDDLYFRFLNKKGDYEDEDYFEDSETQGLVASNSDDDEENLDARFVKVTHAQVRSDEDENVPEYIHVQDFKVKVEKPVDDSWPDPTSLNANNGASRRSPTPTLTSSGSQRDRNMNHTSHSSTNTTSGTSGAVTGPPPPIIPLLNMLDDEDVEEFEAPAVKKKATPGRTYRVTFA